MDRTIGSWPKVRFLAGFPDSRRLTYMAAVDGGWQIHVVDVVSEDITHLTR